MRKTGNCEHICAVTLETDFLLENGVTKNGKTPLHRKILNEFAIDIKDRHFCADHYICWPPPLFIPLVTILEICCFLYYSMEMGDIQGTVGPIPANSLFIYRPDKRFQIWRYIFYMFLHSGWVHLSFNMMVQLVVGIPLEMVHGSVRIGTVYMAGILAGSLGTSVFDMKAFLVGASGGVYALLAAHMANIMLNYSEMELGALKLAAVFIITAADIGFSIWDRYTSDKGKPTTGYVSHLVGALAGLTIGLLVLKHFEQKLHTQILWWLALGIYSICTLFAVLWNIFYY